MKKFITKHLPFFLGSPALIWQFLFFYVPFLCIVLLSFRSFSFEFFIPFLESVYIAVIFRTLLLALSTALICLVFAYPVAYWIVFHAKRWKNVLLFLLFVPFWMNFLLHVYAWMFVLERGGVVNTVLLSMGFISEPLELFNSLFSIVFVMVYCYLPFMILPVYNSLEKFDMSLFEASQDLGGTWWQTFYRIIVPLSMPGITSGFFLVFVPAFGEFAIPELAGGDKMMFAGSVVTHYTITSTTASYGAAFTILTTLIVLVLIALLYVVMWRFSAKESK